MRKTFLILGILLVMVTAGSAQSYTLTDADSNLTDTQLTADFSGLPADTQLTLESLGTDTTEQASFTSTSGGSATVSWRHNPFPDGTALVSDGWTYRIKDSTGDFNYEFEVAHGNMVTALDTFDDGTVNNDVITAETGTAVIEQNSIAEFNPETGGRLYFEQEFNASDTFMLEFGEVTTPGYDIMIDMADGSEITLGFTNTDISELDQSTYKIYYDYNSQEWIFESDGVVEHQIADSSTSVERLALYSGGNGDESEYVQIDSFSHVPRISQQLWETPRKFTHEQTGYNSYLANYNGTLGLEFSTDGSSWSSSLPSNSTSLYYRNTADATIGSVATDTSPLIQDLTFNPIKPFNNTAFAVNEGNELTKDISYEILYERTDCSEYAGLFSSFQLINQSNGNTITDTVYPNLEMTSGQCTFYKSFSESVSLPAGDYTWKVEFIDNDLGISRIYNMEFSIQEGQDVPVSFDLKDPADGSDVELNNGSYQFEYSVDTTTNGTVELVIPQEDPQTIYSTSVDSGVSNKTVVTDLEADTSYNWYLTFTNETTYQSGSNTFTTTADQDTSDPSDGTETTTNQSFSDYTDGTDIDLPGLYYFTAENKLNINGDAADYVAAGVISIGLGLVLGLAVGSAGIAGIGIIFGLLISGLVGLVPGWIIFMFAIISGYILAKIGVFGE